MRIKVSKMDVKVKYYFTLAYIGFVLIFQFPNIKTNCLHCENQGNNTRNSAYTLRTYRNQFSLGGICNKSI